MTLLADTLAVIKRGICNSAVALLYLMWAGAAYPVLAKTPTIFVDPPDDAKVIRTDKTQGMPFDVESHRLPEIVQMRLGSYQPDEPAIDLYTGNWSTTGGFMRFDVVFAGLINPPGPVGLGANGFYSAYEYGPHPVFGFIEFDVDINEQTGGEVDFPELRYLGNVARLGGLPTEPRFQNRVALKWDDLENPVNYAPYVKRSGEEFHLALLGEEIGAVEVIKEAYCGDPLIFEAGEIWVVSGTWLHRAHVFEEFSLQCFAAEGRYMPTCSLRFRHSEYSNLTTVSLVFPLNNAAHASTQEPVPAAQSNNGCPGDQYSIVEALVDLQFSSANADPFHMTFPEFALLADWAIEVPEALLTPGNWRISTCLGSAYPSTQSGSARFVWTDLYPNVLNRDFTGDGAITVSDVAAFHDFLCTHDGNDDIDDDENGSNHSIKLKNFSRSFSLYDSNYDGYVDAEDVVLLGDMDWNGRIEASDVNAFSLGVLDPEAYTQAYPNKLAVMHGDLNFDGLCDGRDIQLFAQLLTGQP